MNSLRVAWQENARFIVAACNSHEDLLAACNWLLAELCEAWDEPAEQAIPAPIRDAIANAEGR